MSAVSKNVMPASNPAWIAGIASSTLRTGSRAAPFDQIHETFMQPMPIADTSLVPSFLVFISLL